MTGIRALHPLPADTDPSEAAGYAQRLRERPGCLEAECYRGIGDQDETFLVSLWADQRDHDRYWTQVLADSGGDPADLVYASVRPDAPEPAPAEFYTHARFRLDRVWVAERFAGDPPKIFWPAAGPVRIIIQSSFADPEGALPALVADELATRREPGCLQYLRAQSVEYPEHFLLLELWRDQAVYDAHWQLRLKTGSGGRKAEPAPRRLGENGLEFYRHQPFRHLYDRWLPADVSRWSETIVWPD
jgi:quinol monooxygenase YgiN